MKAKDVYVVGYTVQGYDMTRHSFVFRMCQKTEANVIKCLDTLERKYKHKFKKIFKTIPMDNGSEFLDFKGIENRCTPKRKGGQHIIAILTRPANGAVPRTITAVSEDSSKKVKKSPI